MLFAARYAAVLTRPELRRAIASSALGRLPIGMAGLAILLLVQQASGSYSQGGAATACYVGGLAAMAPAVGRVIDRFGPRGALMACAALYPAALTALVTSVRYGTSAALTLALAALAGASFPPITACMRTFLKRRLAEESLLAAAYSLESVLIETIFIVGPMLVALFVALLSPDAAVLFAAGCGLAGTLLFARSPALRGWHIEAHTTRSLLGPLEERGFVPLILVVLAYSTAFGLMEIGLTAYANERGSPALAGVLLGVMSVGSAAGGLAYGSRTWGRPLARQFSLTLALMGAGLAALAVRWEPWVFGTVCVLAGIVMAPALIIQAMLVAKTAKAEHVTEAFTWSASALLSGVGLGLAAGGWLLESLPFSAALIAGAGTALAAAAAARGFLGR